MKKRSVLRPWAGHATFGTEKKQFPDRRDFANDQRKTFTGFESMCSPTCVASCLALVSIRIRLLLLIGKHLLAKDSAPWCWWRWWWWGGDHDQNNTETMVDHQVGGWWRSGPPFLFAYSFLFFLDLVFFSGTSIHGVEVVGEWVGGRWGGRRCFSFVC